MIRCFVSSRPVATDASAVDAVRRVSVARARDRSFLIALYIVLAGSLRGGSETRPPFVANVSGAVVFLLGVTYVFGVSLEYGVGAAYVAIVADWVWRTLVVGAVYLRKGWLERGTEMMYERGSVPEDED